MKVVTHPVWLLRDGTVLASARRTVSRAERRRGLIGLPEAGEPLVIAPCRWVHTIGVRVPLDVAYLDAEGTVLRTERLRPGRVAAPVGRARTVIEADAGSFGRWSLRVGDVVEVRDGRA
jgi:hypothetical protein